MQIFDLEYKSGLDRATIRSLLLKIKLLRQLGFSLENNKRVAEGDWGFCLYFDKSN